ncbi:hypothetical protein MLD38_039848 [Melastoma candidum]|uniref:Uncharacterized protein n=1 Tax=Melastoma candidum TaxID=119954 RepID=A0ACB9L5R4_9MYRT|nr:hypothetical protein MLD38_039848 [Melastoma candidum]
MVLSVTARLLINCRGILFPRCPSSSVFAQQRAFHKKPIPVSWEKPNYGWTKLNFDGSLRGGTGKASIGGVFRNHNAEFLLGYAEPIGRVTSTAAEFAALQRGLELILENRWKCVWLEGDALTLVETVEGKRMVKCAEIQRYMTRIKLMIPELRTYKVTHVYREGNRLADMLAQMGHLSEEPRIWTTPPEEVLPIVRDDAQGRTMFRK